jgi:hypothetical protein
MDYIFVMTMSSTKLKSFLFLDFVDNNVMTPFEHDDMFMYSP